MPKASRKLRFLMNISCCADRLTRNGCSFMFPVAMRALPTICLLVLPSIPGLQGAPAHADEEKPLGVRLSLRSSDEQDYCSSVAKAATAAKMAAQETRLRELETLIKGRGEELEAKKRELEALVQRYEALLKRADENLVTVYTRMKPDAAAAQFDLLDDDIAVALLNRMSPKVSSSILSEMKATRGATLVKKLAAYSSAKTSGKPQ